MLLSKSSSLLQVGRLLGLCAIQLLVASVAQAQQSDELGPFRSLQRNESSRHFALELRFGPYLPRVDSEFSDGSHPFRDYFGTKNRVMPGLELDWLPVSVPNVLRFGAGAGVSYTSMTGTTKQADGGTEDPGQDTRFRVLPHWLVGVVRVDFLDRKTPIPVVFTGKLGLANSLWWVKDSPSSSSADGLKGRGQSYGYYYGLGAALNLGILDPYRAKRLDGNMGINAIYLFGELYGMELDSFGKKNAMHVGDRNWVLGLSVDF